MALFCQQELDVGTTWDIAWSMVSKVSRIRLCMDFDVPLRTNFVISANIKVDILSV